ncbi:hypothetical protein PAEPH01_1112 [Pancytospora epiphaga]|nr:hypothetical protein PAEPH01_1112 [Pancytospora epiphaga]
MIVIGELRDGSILLNAISGTTMFIAGLFLMKYYYAEQLVRIHRLYSEENDTKKGVIHSIMASLPYFIFFMVCWDLDIPSKLRCSASIHFVNTVFCIVPFTIMARDHLLSDYSFIKQLIYYSTFTLGAAGLASLNGYLAITAGILQSLLTINFRIKTKEITHSLVPELSYTPEPITRKILQVVRAVLYPLEVFLDWSIISQNSKNKGWMPRLPVRAFISPYLNTFLVLAYYRHIPSLVTMAFISVLTFSVAVILFLCARKSKYRHWIQYYSFIITSIFLYSVISEQLRISEVISRALDCSITTAIVVYMFPYICLLTLLLHTDVHSAGLRQPSLFGVFFSQLLYSFISFGLGIFSGFSHGIATILWDRLLFIAMFLSGGLSLTILHYIGKYVFYVSDLLYVVLFYIVLYGCAFVR